MHPTLRIVLSVIFIGAFGIWVYSGPQGLSQTVLDLQKASQTALASVVRAIKSGDPAAWGTLLTVTFGYGFLHAVGPGHGKAVIGAYGIARRVSLKRIGLIALASSLAQSVFAILLVLAGAFALGLTRERLETLSETALLPLSWALMAMLGLFLSWRGVRGVLAQRAGASPVLAVAGARGRIESHHSDQHHHDHPPDCGCGHHHGPSVEAVEKISGVRDALLVISAVAIRPCSGALFLMVLTLALGIPLAGILGVLTMGLGTASVTIAIALASVWMRENALAALPFAALSRAVPLVELTAGLGLALVSLAMVARTV